MARRSNYGFEKRQKEIQKQNKKAAKDEKKRLKKEGAAAGGGEEEFATPGEAETGDAAPETD